MPLWPQVEWPAEKMAWADFRGKLLGPTDPASAPEGSLRKEIYSKWSELGILVEMDRVDQRDLVSSGLSEFVEYRNCQTSPGRNKHITVGAGCDRLEIYFLVVCNNLCVVCLHAVISSVF